MDETSDNIDVKDTIHTNNVEFIRLNGVIYSIKEMQHGISLLRNLAIIQNTFTGNIIVELMVDKIGARIYSTRRISNELASDCLESCSSAYPRVAIPEEVKPNYIG